MGHVRERSRKLRRVGKVGNGRLHAIGQATESGRGTGEATHAASVADESAGHGSSLRTRGADNEVEVVIRMQTIVAVEVGIGLEAVTGTRAVTGLETVPVIGLMGMAVLVDRRHPDGSVRWSVTGSPPVWPSAECLSIKWSLRSLKDRP